MRLVLDTDVVLSGLQSAGGASRLLLSGIAEGAFTALVTVATLLDYEAVLLRPSSLAATGLTAEAALPGDELPDHWLETADLSRP